MARNATLVKALQRVAPNIDVHVSKVHMDVVPAANKAHSLHFASSDQKQVAKSWGLVVGTMAKGELAGT